LVAYRGVVVPEDAKVSVHVVLCIHKVYDHRVIVDGLHDSDFPTHGVELSAICGLLNEVLGFNGRGFHKNSGHEAKKLRVRDSFLEDFDPAPGLH